MELFEYNEDELLIKVPLYRFVSYDEDTNSFLEFLDEKCKRGCFAEWLLNEYRCDLTEVDLENIINERYDEILEALGLEDEEDK